MSSITNMQIIQYLESQGFKHSNAGFPFIVKILKALCDQTISRQNISVAYAEIADEEHTTKGNVEKCIRFAVKHSKKCFMLSNKEFLCQAYDKLIYDETDIEENLNPETPVSYEPTPVQQTVDVQN